MSYTITTRFKIPIYPNLAQQTYINQTLGCCRKVWNELVGLAQSDYRQHQQDSKHPYLDVSLSGLNKTYQNLREQRAYLKEVPQCAMYAAARTLSQTFQRCFKNIKRGQTPGWPQFKKRGAYASFEVTQDKFYFLGKYLKLPKLDQLVKCHDLLLELPSSPSSVRVIRDSDGRYYASFVCQRPIKVTSGQEILGLDLGIKSLVTLSTGETIENPKALERYLKKLRRYQRRLSRRMKGSKNREKARLQVAKTHKKVSNIRLNHAHQVSRQIVNRARVVGLETLNIKGMVRNRHLARAVSDAGLNQIKRMIRYKSLESLNTRLVMMDTWMPSTQTCSACGTKPAVKIKLGVVYWTCEHCGTRHERDHNAAKNIAAQAQIHLKQYPDSNVSGAVILSDHWNPQSQEQLALYLKAA